MKIVLIITGLGMGGAECQVCDLADKFSSVGHNVILISLTGESIRYPSNTKVRVVTLGMKKTLFGFIKAYYKTYKLIKDFKPDVVHSHMVHANLFTRLLRLSIFIPRLINTAHSSNEGGRGRMLAYRLTDRLCDLNTNVSQKAVDISIARGATTKSKIIPVYNGIDVEKFSFSLNERTRIRNVLEIDDTTPLLLSVGRLTLAKDYPNLLKAFSLLLNKHVDAHLAIIGVGEELSNLTCIAAEYNISSRVHFLGIKNDINAWMSAADIFVLSSAWEGFGLVVAEAMSCERVVVATDCGGVKEVLGGHGFLAPPKDHHALASAITAALDLDCDTKNRMTTLARKHVEENFSLKSISHRWLEIYKK
ncbi:glycosyltransferase [Edwardsiella tarda]|uniref:glycosyltransferase n=1 Tax=Edwardsiella tarda TaxID=636 RepID=UPI003D2ED757